MTKTVKVKPWGEGQGDFVLINEEDLTEAHELFDAPAGMTRAEMFAFLRAAGVDAARNATDAVLAEKVAAVKSAEQTGE